MRVRPLDRAEGVEWLRVRLLDRAEGVEGLRVRLVDRAMETSGGAGGKPLAVSYGPIEPPVPLE